MAQLLEKCKREEQLQRQKTANVSETTNPELAAMVSYLFIFLVNLLSNM